MITIDFRMLRNSGITSYLLNVVPRLVASHPDARFNLLGKPEDRARLPWATAPNVTWVDCPSDIYSLAEQREVVRRTPKDTSLLWVPHYNIPLLYRGPMVVTVHDVAPLAMPQFVRGPHKRLYAKLMFQSLRNKAAAVICVSRFTADELSRHTRGRREQLRVIHLGVAQEWFHVPAAPRPYPRPYLLYVGNVKPHKNLSRLLEAFAQVREQFPHDLLIVGKREGFITPDNTVADRAAALGDRVHFTGHVDDALLRQYFVHADALVFPSLYEGFGLPPLEAMACGCPAVVSDAASLPEVCGDAVLYCDPYRPSEIAARIVRIATDEALRARLAEAGRARAREFTWEKTADATWQVLRDAVREAKTER